MALKTKRTINLINALKGIILVAGSSAYVMNYENVTFWVLIGGAVLDEAAKFLVKDLKLIDEDAKKVRENQHP